MITAQIFSHNGGQAVLLPRSFHVEGMEIGIEKKAEGLLLKSLAPPRFRNFEEVGKYLAESFPDEGEFPDPPPRPAAGERAAPAF